MDIKIKKSECALYLGKEKKDDICISKPIINKLKKEHDINNKTDKEAIKSLKKETGCKNQVCILKRSTDVLGEKEAFDEINTRFIPEGPRDSKKWLSNFNINETLQQWSLMYDAFYYLDCNAIDFDLYGGTLSTFNINDMIKDGCNCFGCVINTDISSGRGRHWFAMFVDMRDLDWTIEHFDSAGTAPRTEMVELRMRLYIEMLELNKNGTVEDIISSTIRHQFSDSECGAYSLYYIWSRLNGIDYDYFRENRIKDSDMYRFRKFLFRSNKN